MDGKLIKHGSNVWFKCISDLVDNMETQEGCLLRSQKGFVYIQLHSKFEQEMVVRYMGHQRYHVRVVDEYSW